MNVVVCVKQTPDTAATVTVENGEAFWGEAPLVLNPWDEYAVEEALRAKEAHGGKVTVISLGEEQAQEALKQALAMGCDEAYLISDPSFEGSDSLIVSQALAAAIGKLDEVGLAFFGRSSVDGDTGLTHAQTARRLGWPILNLVAAIRELDPDAGQVTVERLLDGARQVIRGPLPSVVSVVKEINEPRYPSFMGIRKAARSEIPVWSAADIGLDSVGEPAISWAEVYAPPKVQTECEFIEADSGPERGRKLADRLLEEKVI